MKAKITIIKHNKNYNVVVISKNGLYEYYIEKIGYAHLYFAFATCKVVKLSKEYIEENIEIANALKFWGDIENEKN